VCDFNSEILSSKAFVRESEMFSKLLLEIDHPIGR
jgi:hypothetical protein